VADLKGVLGESNCRLAHVSYHVTVLVGEGTVVDVWSADRRVIVREDLRLGRSQIAGEGEPLGP
jgi:hypothetical protein